MRTFVGGELKK